MGDVTDTTVIFVKQQNINQKPPPASSEGPGVGAGDLCSLSRVLLLLGPQQM